MEIFEKKKELRRYYSAQRGGLDRLTVKYASLKISQHLFDLICRRRADSVLLFYPIKNEPDLLPLVSILNREGISVGFPISVTDPVSLDFRTVLSVDDMEVGAYGICEPSKNSPKAEISGRTVCVVPALAFDREGYRLGYGKGFYDRFLADFEGLSVGVTYDAFLTDSLPRDRYDLCVDMIITQGGVMLPDEVNKSIIRPEKQ